MGKFKSQESGNNIIYPNYITTAASSLEKNPNANYPLKVVRDIAKHKWNSSLSKSLNSSTSQDVAGFLDKFYRVKKDHIIVHRGNLKNISKTNDKIGNDNLSSKYSKLPERFETKEEIESYNNCIATYNMWLNEKVHQELGIKNDDAPKLKRLKGFPSFPLVENPFEDNDSLSITTLLEITNKHQDKAVEYWSNLDDIKFNELIDRYRPYTDKKKKEKKSIEKVSQMFDYYKTKYKKDSSFDKEVVFQNILKYIDIKINSLIKHLSLEFNC